MTRRWLVYGLLFALVACAPTTAIQHLHRVLLVAQIAAPTLLAQTNVPPETREVIVRYLSAVAGATREASVILLDTGTDAEKGARIAAVFAGALRPVLPPGTPQEIVGLVLGISDAVATFLSNYGEWNAKSRLVAPKTTPLSNRDRDELVKILQASTMLGDYVRGEARVK